MSVIVENYIPEEGIMVFSDGGYQRVTSIYNGGFNYRSRIGTDIVPTGKRFVDSCWETGNIYYTEQNNLHKIKYNGDSIADYNGCNATSIAVSQATLPMSTNISSLREDNGCWIVKNTSKELVKTDKDLNVVSTITNLSDPKLVVSSDFDGGCYLFDDGLGWIIKISSAASVVSYISYSSVYSGLTSASLVKRAVTDHSGNLWILSEEYIFKVTLSNGKLTRTVLLDPLSYLGLDPYHSTVSDFDIDKSSNTASLYVVGGCRNKAFLLKYNLNGVIVGSNIEMDIEHPVAIKVTQYNNSSGIYVITESDPQYLPSVCESSSSSSSSHSSSSSSSGETSSSSYASPCCNTWIMPSYISTFPSIEVNGLKLNNTTDCRIWAEFYTGGTPTLQYINIYKSSTKAIANLLASGSLSTSTAGGITLTEANGSGVTGLAEWYESPPGTHPNTVNYPYTLHELTCLESSSSTEVLSTSSSSTSSSSSSYGYSSSSSSSMEAYDCYYWQCGTPIGGSSNACSDFTSWDIDGATSKNTKNGSLVARIYRVSTNRFNFNLYNDNTSSPTTLVATSGEFDYSSLMPTTVSFSSYGGSGISGSVVWSGYGPVYINDNYTLLTCMTTCCSNNVVCKNYTEDPRLPCSHLTNWNIIGWLPQEQTIGDKTCSLSVLVDFGWSVEITPRWMIAISIQNGIGNTVMYSTVEALPGTITLNEYGGSGMSGSVYFDGLLSSLTYVSLTCD